MTAYRRFFVLLSFSCLLVPACSDDSSTQSASSSSSAGGTDASGGAGSGASGGSVGEGGAGGGSTMGASVECQECSEKTFTPGTDCEQTIQDCDADADCDAWKNCTEECFNADDTPECYQACEANFPKDENLSEPLLKCLCDECVMECAAACSIQ